MSHHVPYIQHDAEARDQSDWNPEWSRRARGFSTHAAVRHLGRSGVCELVERCCQHARELVRGIATLPGAELVCEPRINQGLVRFLDPLATDHHRYTKTVIRKIVLTGEAFFGPTTWDGVRCMRVSVSNWQTSEADIQRAIQAVASALAR